MKRAIILAAGALSLAACMGTPPVTQLGEDVPSYCIQSRAAYDGHMDFCAVKACSAADVKQAEAVQAKAKAICANHASADLATLKALVNEQRSIGRRK